MNWPNEQDHEQLKNAPLTPIYISGMDMLSLLGMVQLALRHPATKNMKGVARVFAQELEKRIVEAAPGFKDLCAAGWNPKEDR